MKGMTLRYIADACGGVLHLSPGREDLASVQAECIITDSRKACPGAVFAAIKGERVDGHSFIPQVFESGALAVITEQDLPQDAGYPAWIRVPSTIRALQAAAAYYLQVMDIPVVGITGSVGKTSTKEMIASVLSQKYCVHRTAGNFNNELGLPLTIFDLRDEHEIAVLEMGISNFGEMHRLAGIAKPDTCVITNIGRCHLEFLGDRDGVLRAKTEIFDFLDENGCIILNGNDDKLTTIQPVHGIRPVFFGIPEEDGQSFPVWADRIENRGLDGISCRIHTPEGTFEALVPVPGRHMVMNALAAAAVGLHYGLTVDQIRQGIESLETISGRFHLIRKDGLTIVDDCYNANPASMQASLASLSTAPAPRTAILGDMFELGEDALSMHREVGRSAAESGLDLLVCIGPMSRQIMEGALEVRPSLPARHYETLQAFLDEAGELLHGLEGTLLIKASHGMKFDRIVEALTKED